MTTRFLISPEDKGSKETWETTSLFDDVIYVIAVFEVGGRTTLHYAATLLIEDNKNNTLYSSQREIKAIVRSHNEEHISVILNHEPHAHTHS